MSHFKAKMLQIRFPASVRPSVRLLDGGWHLLGAARYVAIHLLLLRMHILYYSVFENNQLIVNKASTATWCI